VIAGIAATVVALILKDSNSAPLTDASAAPHTDPSAAGGSTQSAAEAADTPRPLAVAPAWPYISGCPAVGQVAMPPGMGKIETFHAVTDIRPTLASSGAGSWTRGVLYLDLSATGAQAVEIINIQPHIDRRDLAPPAWIYSPNDGCGPRNSERDFVFNLDAPHFSDVGATVNDAAGPPPTDMPTAALGPDFTLSGTRHARIRVNVSSCHGNYEWNLDVQYVRAGSSKIEHYLVGPFQSFGVANNTTVYQGYQDKTGSIHIDNASTLTGSDPILAGSESSADSLFTC
jgi:hypothetical protein